MEILVVEEQSPASSSYESAAADNHGIDKKLWS